MTQPQTLPALGERLTPDYSQHDAKRSRPAYRPHIYPEEGTGAGVKIFRNWGLYVEHRRAGAVIGEYWLHVEEGEVAMDSIDVQAGDSIFYELRTYDDNGWRFFFPRTTSRDEFFSPAPPPYPATTKLVDDQLGDQTQAVWAWSSIEG